MHDRSTFPPEPNKIGRRYRFDRNGKVEHYRLLTLRPPCSRIQCICHAYSSVGGIVKGVFCLMIYGGQYSKSDTTSYLPAPWFLPHTLCLSLLLPQPLRPWGVWREGRKEGGFARRRPEILGWRSKLGCVQGGAALIPSERLLGYKEGARTPLFGLEYHRH